MIKNEELSRQLAKKIQARWIEKIRARWIRGYNTCYNKAWRAWGELAYKGFYVEGYVVGYPSPFWFENGWLEYNGEIVDPTYPTEPFTYFVGLRLPYPEAHKLLGQGGETVKPLELPLFHRFGRGGCDHPGIMAAAEAAKAESNRILNRLLSGRMP